MGMGILSHSGARFDDLTTGRLSLSLRVTHGDGAVYRGSEIRGDGAMRLTGQEKARVLWGHLGPGRARMW
jgi:hypothetical protein